MNPIVVTVVHVVVVVVIAAVVVVLVEGNRLCRQFGSNKSHRTTPVIL